jgi:hypothetical protein
MLIEAVETVNRSYGEAFEREFPAALCTTIWRVLHSMATKPGCPDPDEGLELRPEIIAKLQEPIDSDTLISHAEMSARLTHQRLMLEKVPCRKHKPPASRSQYRRFAVQCDSCDGNGEVLRFPTLGGDSRIPVRTLDAVVEAALPDYWVVVSKSIWQEWQDSQLEQRPLRLYIAAIKALEKVFYKE